jgi:RNA polymerase sigma-B factor
VPALGGLSGCTSDGEREELFRRHLPLARSLASRYPHTPESLGDLFEVASLGLRKAIDRYDPTRRDLFSSLAVATMLGELRRHRRDLQELSQRVGPATDELAVRLGRPPTVPEIAAALAVSSEQLLDARQALAAQESRATRCADQG